MRDYLYPGDTYDVQIDIRHTENRLMSLGGVLDDYNAAYPVAEKTQQARARELDKIITSQLNKLIRFMLDIAHQPLKRGSVLWIDFEFKGLYFSFSNFDVNMVTYRLIGNKPLVWVTVEDYIANGGNRTAMMITYQKRKATRTKRK